MNAALTKITSGGWLKVIALFFAFILSFTLVPSNEAYAGESQDEAAKTIVPVTKLWNDANDQDGIRPDSVKVMLFADGIYTGKTLTLTEKNNWHASFIGLDKYADCCLTPCEHDKRLIVYTVLEVVPEGYLPLITPAPVAGYIITNTHVPAVVDVTGTKLWNDADNQDGIRPESITVNLLANGVEVDSQEVTADAEGNWNFSFTCLPKYEKGVEIVYSIDETAVEGYEAFITESDVTKGLFTVTNVHEPEVYETVTVTKVWDDAEDKDGVRPESVTVTLLANGSPVAKVELNAEGNWMYAWQAMPKYADGELIRYEVLEGEAADEDIAYTAVYTGNVEDGFVITNTHVPAAEPVTPVEPEDEEKDTNGEATDPVIPDNDEKEEGALPQTGDTTNFFAFAMVAIAAAIVLAMAYAKINSPRGAHVKKR